MMIARRVAVQVGAVRRRSTSQRAEDRQHLDNARPTAKPTAWNDAARRRRTTELERAISLPQLASSSRRRAGVAVKTTRIEWLAGGLEAPPGGPPRSFLPQTLSGCVRGTPARTDWGTSWNCGASMKRLGDAKLLEPLADSTPDKAAVGAATAARVTAARNIAARSGSFPESLSARSPPRFTVDQASLEPILLAKFVGKAAVSACIQPHF